MAVLEALLLCSRHHLILLSRWTRHTYIILVCLNFKSASDGCPTDSLENEHSVKLVLIVKTFFLISSSAKTLVDSGNIENMLQPWTYFRYIIKSLQIFFRLNKVFRTQTFFRFSIVYIISGLCLVFFREDLDGVKHIQQIIHWCSMEQQTNYIEICYRQQLLWCTTTLWEHSMFVIHYVMIHITWRGIVILYTPPYIPSSIEVQTRQEF